MPNHVYNTITIDDVNDKNLKILKDIYKIGFCRYFMARPEILQNYGSPLKVVSEKEYEQAIKEREESIKEGNKYLPGLPITEKLQKEFLEKYEATNWYDWSCKHWGTKWGAYEGQLDDDTYSFSSAWSPPNIELFRMFSKIIPNFCYTFVEETGWGGEIIYKNGEISYQHTFDSPEWDEPIEIEEDDNFKPPYTQELTYLIKDHKNLEGEYKKGYYLNYNLEIYFGLNKEEAIEKIKKTFKDE